MIDLQLDKFQTHYCEQCKSWLDFRFDLSIVKFSGITIVLNDIPILHCHNCDEYYFTDKIKDLIISVIKETKKQKKDQVKMSPKHNYKKRFHYANEVKFLYDHRDYEHIPGLLRPQNDGFLTPVFFNLAVLNKYSQYPDYRLDLFSKTYGSVNHNDDFNIPFGINRNKKVIMWLGDLDKLPKEEQHYLRSENVESDHDLYSEFYDAQVETQFSNPSPENTLFHTRSECIKICKQKYNKDLYKLQGEVSKIIENLDRPVFWEEKTR